MRSEDESEVKTNQEAWTNQEVAIQEILHIIDLCTESKVIAQ